MINTLKTIAKALNQASIEWCIGGSLVLYYSCLIENVHDIDIIVAENNYEKARAILQEHGLEYPVPESTIFISSQFSKFKVNNTKVDLISGFKIKTSLGIYHYIFDDLAISKTIELGDVVVPTGALEDWYVLYHLMPNRESKIAILDNHFLSHPSNTRLLKRALKQSIPKNVKEAVLKIVKKQT